ncbi:MAG: hypothetical protein V4722_05965 [Bacteroidota bacterium]
MDKAFNLLHKVAGLPVAGYRFELSMYWLLATSDWQPETHNY